jgi:hypothetical protein
MIVQIELQLRKCTRLVQCNVKIWFEFEDRNTQVYRLKKDLYRLKKSPRAWYGRIDSFLRSLGFTKSKDDYNLYLKVMNDDPVMLLLYVYDVFLTRWRKYHHILQKKLATEFDERPNALSLRYWILVEHREDLP